MVHVAISTLNQAWFSEQHHTLAKDKIHEVLQECYVTPETSTISFFWHESGCNFVTLDLCLDFSCINVHCPCDMAVMLPRATRTFTCLQQLHHKDYMDKLKGILLSCKTRVQVHQNLSPPLFQTHMDASCDLHIIFAERKDVPRLKDVPCASLRIIVDVLSLAHCVIPPMISMSNSFKPAFQTCDGSVTPH